MKAPPTPSKRRVLGSLDVNAHLSPRASRSPSMTDSPLKKARRDKSSSLSRNTSPSPGKRADTARKRRLDEGGPATRPAVKKLCPDAPVEPAAASGGRQLAPPAHRDTKPATITPRSSTTITSSSSSSSPEASSLLDVSPVVTSHDTTITEPDVGPPPTAAAPHPLPPDHPYMVVALSLPRLRPRPVSTPEEIRQKVELLKLRLSLATYKVMTGQTDVSFDKLQMHRLPGMDRRRTPLPSMSAHTIERTTPAQQWYRSATRAATAASSLFPSSSAPSSGHRAQVDNGDGDGAGAGAGAKCGQAQDKDASAFSVPPHRSHEKEEEVEERPTSSALKGGAVKGLLSLSQASL